MYNQTVSEQALDRRYDAAVADHTEEKHTGLVVETGFADTGQAG